MPMAPSGTTHSPCGACKFLRRKCAFGCVFAPYFSSEQGPAQFAAIHKVFGASNVSKLLHHLPVEDRYEAAVTIGFEAEARLQEPVYGCVAHIFALQQQVAYLQAQLIQVKAHMVCNHQCHHHEVLRSNDNHNVCGVITTPVSSLDSNIDQSYSDESTLRVDTYNYIRVPPTSHHNQSTTTTTTGYKNDKVQTCGNKKRPRDEYGVGELHELALRMIRK